MSTIDVWWCLTTTLLLLLIARRVEHVVDMVLRIQLQNTPSCFDSTTEPIPDKPNTLPTVRTGLRWEPPVYFVDRISGKLYRMFRYTGQ